MAGTKRSCRNRFCCFSSSASDEEGKGHPASAGPRSSSSGIDNTTETLPGPPKRTEAPLSESQNIPRKSEGENVNAHPNVSGATQCDEPSSSGSSNLPVKSEGEHVDFICVCSRREMAGTKRSCRNRFCCFSSSASDEEGQGQPASAGPLSSSSAIDNTTETLPGPPKRTEAPIPGSSIDLQRSRMYPEQAVGIEKSIEEVLSLLECESAQNAVTVILHGFGGMGKTTLADAVFSRVRGYRYSRVRLFQDIDSKPNITELQKKILKDLMGPEEPVPDIRKYQHGQLELRERLEKIEAFIYIDNVLEGAALKQLLPEDMSTAKKVRLLLTARNKDVKNACPRPCTKPKIYKMEGIQHQAALRILKSEIKDGINDSQFDEIIDTCGGIPLMLTLTAAYIGRADNKEEAYATLMTRMTKEVLSHTYPTHAVGIAEPIEKVFRLLEIQSDDQNAVTVILHGFGGMGKTTLADAVFSEIGGEGMGKIALPDAGFWKIRGGKRSKVQLFDGIKSTPDITALQKQILKDLMEPGETPPEINTHKDGQQALEGVLRKIHAFIYIDNVLEAAALEKLLPQDMSTAKKVRLLLTARNEKVSDACPRSRTEPKFYNMQTIHDPEAMVILKREIEEGLTEDQFSDIIQICGGIPLMLTLAAASIGHADNKAEAYATLMEQKGTKFEEMRYAFAYHTLPHECKDPFQDICTYFNGWNWNIVKDIVGDDALMKLKSRALVTRTTKGFASVHDVIIALAHGMSKEESKDKEVRRKFTNASELKKFLEEGDTEGITGIWLTERKEDGDDRKEVVVQASALDKMQKSLRVLQLGNSVKVEGNCNEIFKELCFFKANISRLPFTVSKLTQLRYLSFDPPNWVRSSLPSSLAIMNFDGKTFQTYN